MAHSWGNHFSSVFKDKLCTIFLPWSDKPQTMCIEAKGTAFFQANSILQSIPEQLGPHQGMYPMPDTLQNSCLNLPCRSWEQLGSWPNHITVSLMRPEEHSEKWACTCGTDMSPACRNAEQVTQLTSVPQASSKTALRHSFPLCLATRMQSRIGSLPVLGSYLIILCPFFDCCYFVCLFALAWDFPCVHPHHHCRNLALRWRIL